ncbi:radical SAM family heme chaperone HemW [Helicobacter sp. NHP22-001]|uniref:radical SAM family heme chaperone HemW n=1 Tax=Helicobacter sp. NHP22-001 TaxID=3040202 RepID=UPI00244D91D8|nr:radical SAM family heme chaperone HemW [Helicobacter sp. NHP22-001]GMB96038.1 Coproporphyrinogen III oxidase HemN [Helicobacter sp. NHP22-001]
MLKSTPPRAPSLYIHVPFCTSKCGYCAFNSFSGLDSLKDAYVEALIVDLKDSLKSTPVLSSIFIGGGTPNTLEPKHYEYIFNTIATHTTSAQNIEITLEANPDLITKEWCKTLRALGANRLSLGVQSFFADKLRFLQREHSQQDIFKALEIAHTCGFNHLSIDLIYNTPLDMPARLKAECMQANTLPIDHLSAYSLTLEDNTRLAKSTAPSALLNADSTLQNILKDLGFTPYEVSNYAKPYQVQHNLGYWAGCEYLGCGAGAVGRMGKERFYKQKYVLAYIKDPLKRRIEHLSDQDLEFERLFLGLRCVLGVELKGLDPKKTQTLVEEEKCKISNQRLVACDFFLADEIALWLT